MYTQCPECKVAFRITAEVLQQARGKVRCGSCGDAFNAIDHLSESPPRPTNSPVARQPGEEAGSRALMDSLSRLADSEDVRIEDTGIEWRVVDRDDVTNIDTDGNDDESPDDRDTGDLQNAESDDHAGEEPEPARPAREEPRYDDNTPLPEDFFDDNPETPPYEPPRRRATDLEFVGTEADNDAQSELELSEPEDWADLLDDVQEDPVDAGAQDATSAHKLDTGYEGAEGPRETGFGAEPLSTGDDGPADEIPELDEESDGIVAADGGDSFYDSELSLVTNEDEDVDIIDEDDADGIEYSAAAPEDDGAMEEINLSDALEDDDDEYARNEQVDSDGAGKAGLGKSMDAEVPYGDSKTPTPDDDETSATPDFGSEAGDAAPDDLEDSVELGAIDEADVDEYEIETEADESLDDAEELKALVNGGAETEAPDHEEALNADSGEFGSIAAADASDEGSDDRPAGDDEEKEEDDFAAMTANMQIDPAVLKAMRDGEFGEGITNEDGSPLIETIIMEGDFVRDSLDDSFNRRGALEGDDPASLLDTYITTRASEKRGINARLYMGIGIFVLLFGLAVQYVHSQREYLATFDFFNSTIGPIYRSVGMPVTPNWDIKGWQFEATSGSTGDDEQILTITSRISNRSAQSLPYPLVHVSLTDRYEEIIGSSMLEPDEYLGEGDDPSLPVAPGDRFTATITVSSTSTEATGFKLNVCYHEAGNQVRCAIEDFKEP